MSVNEFISNKQPLLNTLEKFYEKFRTQGETAIHANEIGQYFSINVIKEGLTEIAIVDSIPNGISIGIIIRNRSNNPDTQDSGFLVNMTRNNGIYQDSVKYNIELSYLAFDSAAQELNPNSRLDFLKGLRLGNGIHYINLAIWSLSNIIKIN